MIVDIREVHEYKRRPSKGINIPEHQLKNHIQQFNEQKSITFICAHGFHSRRIAYMYGKILNNSVKIDFGRV